MRTGRIVALDYGRKRVGIAVTDINQIIANPYTTVHSSEIFDFLKKYVEEEEVVCFVIGDPKQMNNKPSESVSFIKPFVKRLKKEFPEIDVEFVDERFTSLMASRAMIEAGLKKKDRQNKALVDSISAAIILQSYLESRKYKKKLGEIER